MPAARGGARARASSLAPHDVARCRVAEPGPLQRRAAGPRHVARPRRPRRARAARRSPRTGEEPRVDLRQLAAARSTRPAALERRERAPTCGGRSAIDELPSQRGDLVVLGLVGCAEQQRPACPSSSDRIALQERLLERAADRHRLADRLHLRGERAVGLAGTSRSPSAGSSRRRSRSSARRTPASRA